VNTFAPDPVTLFDGGFGPAIVSVTAAGGQIARPPMCGALTKKDMGKAPGVLTLQGWIPYDCRKEFCQTRDQAFVMRDQWGGNVGIRGGLPLGLFWIDNDQGEEFSRVIQDVLGSRGVNAPRRFVLSPEHKHDAFLLRMVDFGGGPTDCANREVKFVKGVNVGKFQILGHGKQAVAGGVHPGTLQPYVWDRQILDVDDIPEIASSDWPAIYQEIISGIEAIGWVLQSGQRAVPAGPTSNVATLVTIGPGVTTSTPDEVRELLSWLPNDGTGPKALNDFLALCENYINIGYATYGALGATPEAKAIWLSWTKPYPQKPENDPEIRWASIINQTPPIGRAPSGRTR
jgi:hypothetical protein